MEMIENSPQQQILIGEGWVSHARPLQSGRAGRSLNNAFRYPIFNLLIPVHQEKELAKLSAGSGFSVSATDYLEGQSGSLFRNAQDFLLRHVDYHCDEIWLQTLPRLLGYVFNPITLYFCFKADGTPHASVVEVGNTFRELKPYLVPRAQDGKCDFEKTEDLQGIHSENFFAGSG
jgi:DUF1365 family protein